MSYKIKIFFCSYKSIVLIVYGLLTKIFVFQANFHFVSKNLKTEIYFTFAR